ncbi:small ubiquitin-related modifier 1-like [Prunus avium]|uniref:Small ubiquitin-related modifier 1-like n=1 Tax=Prunus avium TaxID=42229 RepID=A0A6P5S1J3_PRUAV|nr:small ubiquitin-related modifier 1-like [Prunus avium]
MGIGRRVPVGPQRNILGVPKQRPSHITLSVHDHLGGNDLVFRMKRSTQLWRLMIAYCDRKSVAFNRMRFAYDGVPLLSSRTPDEYDLESGDVIDVIHAFPVLRGGGAP